MEAFGGAGLATEHSGEAGPGAVHARLERVAGGACSEHLRPGLRITGGASWMGYGEHQQADQRQPANFEPSPPHATRITPIIPAAWCSRMWQWNIHSPGLSATKAISTRSRGAIRTVSCHSWWRVG